MQAAFIYRTIVHECLIQAMLRTTAGGVLPIAEHERHLTIVPYNLTQTTLILLTGYQRTVDDEFWPQKWVCIDRPELGQQQDCQHSGQHRGPRRMAQRSWKSWPALLPGIAVE